MCTDCAQNYDSTAGAENCTLAAEGYFISPKNSLSEKCPNGAECRGSNERPRPKSGFWVDRSSLDYIDAIYTCPRSTCKGVTLDDEIDSGADGLSRRRLVDVGVSANESSHDVNCWGLSVEKEGARAEQCDDNQLLCEKGSEGPLCGTCSTNYVFSAAISKCIACDSASNNLPAILLGVLTLCGAGAFIFHRRQRSKDRRHLFTSARTRHLFRSFREYLARSGMLKVAWSTMQICSTISWSLSVKCR